MSQGNISQEVDADVSQANISQEVEANVSQANSVHASSDEEVEEEDIWLRAEVTPPPVSQSGDNMWPGYDGTFFYSILLLCPLRSILILA